MNTLYLKSGNYMYKISYNPKGGLPKYREARRIIPKIRSPTSIYFDKHDDMFKEIVYPETLHYTEVISDDPVERYIQSIIDFMPEWTKIEVEPLDTKST